MFKQIGNFEKNKIITKISSLKKYKNLTSLPLNLQFKFIDENIKDFNLTSLDRNLLLEVLNEYAKGNFNIDLLEQYDKVIYLTFESLPHDYIIKLICSSSIWNLLELFFYIQGDNLNTKMLELCTDVPIDKLDILIKGYEWSVYKRFHTGDIYRADYYPHINNIYKGYIINMLSQDELIEFYNLPSDFYTNYEEKYEEFDIPLDVCNVLLYGVIPEISNEIENILITCGDVTIEKYMQTENCLYNISIYADSNAIFSYELLYLLYKNKSILENKKGKFIELCLNQ